MCGICGNLKTTTSQPPEIGHSKRMMALLRHRGPDSSGYYRDPHVARGHLRSSIIDLATGEQPLSNEDGTLWIAFSGEILNYLELRRALMDHGHQFRTQSDMEFLFLIQRSVGPGAVGYKQKQLLLSRDRVGIRLLYYTQTGGVFLFASEIKSLLAYPVISHQLDPPGHAETFTFWSPIGPWTAFEGIRELELGHADLVQNGRHNTQPYWKLTFPEAGTEKIHDESETAERLRGTLILAAKLRFERSDVPVGPYLSGGIDSSISAAIINRYTYAPPKTFSILFEDSEFDEGGYQHAMIDRLGTDHRDIVVGYRDIGDIFPRVV